MKVRAWLIAIAVALPGCPMSRQSQLENVAKDWCLTVRASQVIPVYPLTEDLQPGDVFLVTVPVDQQHTIYMKRGFLPLDNHIGRLDPSGYATFYGRSFDPQPPTLPKTWLNPGEEKWNWAGAPTAAFPSYSFSTTKGGGLSMALPVSGVPIGLSLLGAQSATGSITISDARTYGIDAASLIGQMDEFAKTHSDFLRSFAPKSAKELETTPPRYLRVVSRVYLTQKIDIVIRDARSASGGLSAGAPKPVEIMSVEATDDPKKASMTAYDDNLKKLNASLAALGPKAGEDVLPGGTVKVAAASARSVSLQETFPRPLVIGYLGFDMRILPGGRLGAPIPSLAVIERRATPGTAPAFFGEVAVGYREALRRLNGKDAATHKAVLTALDADLGAAFNPTETDLSLIHQRFLIALGPWEKEQQDEGRTADEVRQQVVGAIVEVLGAGG